MSVETELKLTLTPTVARQLLKSGFWKPLRRGRIRRRHLSSTYFDTPQHLFRHAGMALRIRDDGQSREQTLKVPIAGPPGLQNFEEWTIPVAGSRPLLEAIRGTGRVPFLAEPRAARRIAPVFTTEFDRTAMVLRTNAAEIELAVDLGHIRVARNGSVREEEICELELELMSGNAGELSELALQICENWDALPAHRTKAERGYALARPSLRPVPSKPGKLQLLPEMTVGEAFERVITDALQHLFANRIPTLQGKPEGIHQTRVAIRRLRAALRAFKRILPYRERKAFNGELRWFQQRLSPARDWHVFLTESLPHISTGEADCDESLRKLRRIAASERRRATAIAKEHLLSRRYARLILQFQQWVGGLEQSVAPKQWQQPLVPFARRVLRKSSRELLHENRPLTRLPVEDLHELRKRGKKGRYATEFFSSLWARSDTRPYAKLMEKLQDRLGEANDAGVASRILLTMRPGRLDAELVQFVQNASQQRAHACVVAARPHWRRLRRKARPFWNAPAERSAQPTEKKGGHQK